MDQAIIQARIDAIGEKYKELIDSQSQCILDEKDEEELLSYLNSSDEIIRAGAVDLLGYSDKQTTRDILIEQINRDKSRIVRAYCCSALCDIAFERKETEYVITFLTQALKKEHSIFVKLAWIADLAQYSNSMQLEDYKRTIEQGLRCKSRHNRYLAAEAILSDPRFLTLFDVQQLKKIEKKEKCFYIRSELMTIIHSCGRKKIAAE